jgi:hypothetical protein
MISPAEDNLENQDFANLMHGYIVKAADPISRYSRLPIEAAELLEAGNDFSDSSLRRA